jgi:hypothetical protein
VNSSRNARQVAYQVASVAVAVAAATLFPMSR